MYFVFFSSSCTLYYLEVYIKKIAQSHMPNRNLVVATATLVTVTIRFHKAALSCFILNETFEILLHFRCKNMGSHVQFQVIVAIVCVNKGARDALAPISSGYGLIYVFIAIFFVKVKIFYETSRIRKWSKIKTSTTRF